MAFSYSRPFLQALSLHGDGTTPTNMGIKVASLGNATYIETGSGVEDEWTLSTHGLVVGAKVQFSAVGTGATGYAVSTDYWVAEVPDANTFTLAAAKGGAAIEGTGDSSGIWTIARQAEDYYVDGANETTITISRIIVAVRDNADMVGSAFGAIAGSLSTGVDLNYVESDDTVITSLTPDKIVNNLTWAQYVHDVKVHAFGGTPDAWTLAARWDFDDFYPGGLVLSDDRKLVCNIADDLSTLVSFHITAEGFVKLGA